MFLPGFQIPFLTQRRSIMFEPDTLLPEQFFSLLGRKPLQGEKRLLLAMLEDAVHCFQTYLLARKPHERRLFQEAEEWIDSRDSQWFFSFENICHYLQKDPCSIREKVCKLMLGKDVAN